MRHGGLAAVDTALNLKRPFLGVFSAKEGLVDIFSFSPHWARQEPDLSFVKVAKTCALRVHPAVELRRKRSNDGVEKSAHDPT